MLSQPREKIAKELTDAGYTGLFLSGDRSLADSVWQNGANRNYLEQIVRDSHDSDWARLLASELLFAKVSDYPPEDWRDILGYLYSRALAMAGDRTGAFRIPGNLWGFMFYSDADDMKDYGALGTRIIEIGPKAIPYLAEQLDNANTLFYVGSQEATLGNSLHYRVKDAAAYYIGQISGIPVRFFEETGNRDAEIERLRDALKNYKQREQK